MGAVLLQVVCVSVLRGAAGGDRSQDLGHALLRGLQDTLQGGPGTPQAQPGPAAQQERLRLAGRGVQEDCRGQNHHQLPHLPGRHLHQDGRPPQGRDHEAAGGARRRGQGRAGGAREEEEGGRLRHEGRLRGGLYYLVVSCPSVISGITHGKHDQQSVETLVLLWCEEWCVMSVGDTDKVFLQSLTL